MAALAEEAEALAWGLSSGIVGVDEVIRWADARVLSEAAPCAALCEVATSSRLHPLDLASLLRTIPGEPEPEIVHDLRVRLMLQTLDQGEQFARVVAMAIDHAYLGEWSDDVGLGTDGASVLDTLEQAGEAGDRRAAVIAAMKALLGKHVSKLPRVMFDRPQDI